MNGLEENILSIVNIKPWPVLSGFSRIIVEKDWATALLSKLLWLLHTLYYFLGSISVMYIKVNDCDFLDLFSISAHYIWGRDSHIVDIAKSICLLLVTFIILKSFTKDSSMMAWWSDSTEGVPKFLRHYLITCFDNCSTWEKSGFPSLRWDHGIPIIFEERLSVIMSQLNSIDDMLDVPKIMDFQNISFFCGDAHFLKVCIS